MYKWTDSRHMYIYIKFVFCLHYTSAACITHFHGAICHQYLFSPVVNDVKLLPTSYGVEWYVEISSWFARIKNTLILHIFPGIFFILLIFFLLLHGKESYRGINTEINICVRFCSKVTVIGLKNSSAQISNQGFGYVHTNECSFHVSA